MNNIFRFLFVTSCLLFSMSPLHAQWLQTNGPYGGSLTSFAVSSPYLFAGTSGDGRFLFYIVGKDELWKMVLPQGTRQRLRNVFRGLRKGSSSASLSLDGKQIVYSAYQRIGKYVLIEQPFR